MKLKNDKVKIGFICVHNSCRSQMAEAIAKQRYGDLKYEFYSAGTEKKDNINSDAVETIKQLYNINIEDTQRPKLLNEIPKLDVVITMGCNVECPYLPSSYREDFGIDDPTGEEFEVFRDVVNSIESKLDILIKKIVTEEIKI